MIPIDNTVSFHLVPITLEHLEMLLIAIVHEELVRLWEISTAL